MSCTYKAASNAIPKADGYLKNAKELYKATPTANPESDGYLKAANELHNFFIVFQKCPGLLFNYLKTGNKEMVKEAMKLFLFQKTDGLHLHSWASILCQIPLNEINSLFQNIFCHLWLPSLSTEDRKLMEKYQTLSKNKLFENLSLTSNSLKTIIHRLTNFFVKQFEIMCEDFSE